MCATWEMSNPNQGQCPYCLQPIQKGLSPCPHCGTIIDWEYKVEVKSNV
jgi:endogenous inhibitor of DNA gyrase (YacG/DUF329 family)